jgi:hypothetical protein
LKNDILARPPNDPTKDEQPTPSRAQRPVLVGVSFAATVGEQLDGVIRVVTLFTLLARSPPTAATSCAPGLDPFPIITRWSAVGLGLGVAIELLRAVS